MGNAGARDRRGGTGLRGSGWAAVGGVALCLTAAQPSPGLAAGGGDPGPAASGAAVVAQDAAEPLREELASARQEIEALRATGAEMQRGLDARDAALAELRGRSADALAAAVERADRLTAERDETLQLLEAALARIALLEGELTALAAPAAEAAPEEVANGLAAAKAGLVPAPSPKPPLETEAVLNAAAGGAAPAAVASPGTPVPSLARVQARLAGLPGVEAGGSGRLVLTASMLSSPGHAELSERGRADLAPVAEQLRRSLAELPPGTPWTLHVDGHTDDVPVRRSGFGSNLELSRARAQAVADYLAERGVPAERLAVAGFADRQPLVAGTTEAARGRNRRIELRLAAE
jgi:chemotaxis protein MotB